MEYVPYFELAGRPHVIADGSGRRSTVLTISHWPQSGTPWPLKADLSAEMAFRYLAQPEFHVDCDAVSNDHLDLDGFIAVLALARPEFAVAHQDLLVEVARAGDFATTASATARRVAFVLDAFTDPDRSPLPAGTFEQQRPHVVAQLYQQLLDVVPDIVADVDAFEPLWVDEEARLVASEEAFAHGVVEIEERPALDLAVVRLDPEERLGGPHRFSLQKYGPVHPLAVHARTGMFRVLYLQGPRYGLLYRFESFVQYMSRRPLPRVDLAPLAAELTERERDGAVWQWAWPQQPNPPVPWLAARDVAPSTIPSDTFVDVVTDFLANTPDGIDPYDGADGVHGPPGYGPGVDLAETGSPP